MKYIVKSQGILFKCILFFIIFCWCMGFSIIPLFPSNPLSMLLPFARYSYSLVCHQDEAKSFIINNIHLFVCARCTGIYTGALLSSLITIFIFRLPRISLRIASFSLFPIIIDWIMYNSGVYNYSKNAAFISGLFPGSVLFVYILNSFGNFFEECDTFNEQK